MSAHTGSLPNSISPGFFPGGQGKGAVFFPNWRRVGGWTAGMLALALGGMIFSHAIEARHVAANATAKKSLVAPVTVPAQVIANLFVVRSLSASGEVRHFIIDTGSSITLVSPEFAATHATSRAAQATIVAPNGRRTERERVTLATLVLGQASFRDVPAVVSDMDELSRYLGVRIDGIVGFPLFKQHLLTLDYARQEMTIAAASPVRDAVHRGLVFPMNTDARVPFVTMRVGGQAEQVLIDTGSDGGLQLNPEEVEFQLMGPAKAGALVSTVAGDRRQYLGRIANRVEVGGVAIEAPVVDFMLGTSSVGGEVLRNFALTFDQQRNEVTFRKTSRGAVTLGERRTVGLSFSREADAWAVAGVVPGTPTAALALQAGDRCVQINGESVAQWPAERFAQLLKTSEKVTFTFARNGAHADVQIPVVNLLE